MKNLFPSLPETPHLADVFRAFPKGLRPLLELHDALLREDSEFSVAERELIAAYVSGLNQCKFCYASHKLAARAFGVDPALVEALVHDPHSAEVDGKMRPVLAYVKILTETPYRLTEADAKAVYDAGWSEEALYDAVAICALYNYMNRIVDGTGVLPGAEYEIPSEEDLRRRRASTYMDWARGAGLLD